MKQKNVSVFSLLASFMLLIFAVSAYADTEVTFVSGNVVHDCEETLTVEVTADDAIKCFDVVAELASSVDGAFAEVVDVILHTACGSDNGFDLSMVDATDPDKFRFWGCDLASCCDVIPAGTQVLAEIVVQVGSDLGAFTIDGSDLVILEDNVIAETSFLGGSCEETNLTINAGTYTVINTDPYFTNCPPLIEHECADGVINFDFDADDDDCGTTLTYSLGAGTGGTINATTGVWTKDVSQMCGVYDYQVIVTDEHGAQAACNFTLSVTTETPEIVDCSDYRVVWGDLAESQVVVDDPDDCPAALEFSLVGITGNGGAPFPGVFNLNSATGEWSVQTEDNTDWITDPDDPWMITVEASDGCETVSCSFALTVVGLRVDIEKLHGDEFGVPGEGVFQGQYVWVDVDATIGGTSIGGYDLLLTYDASALTFVEAVMGADLEDCDWEYFTYRFGPFGNCGGTCPSGMLRIVAMAETNDGPHHPTCFPWGEIELASLKFFVTNDRTFECQYVPIGYYWFDCGDNTISNRDGDSLFIAREVYLYYEDGIGNWVPQPQVDVPDGPFSGWQTLGVACDTTIGTKPGGISEVDFYEGGVDIVCADDIDARGDLNLNNIANEIADAVLYTNYFVFGMSVFDINVQGQVAASDVNADGRVLTVGDLVYLVRVIQGDAVPYAKLTPFAMEADAAVKHQGDMVKVATNSSVNIGAALFVFDVDGTVTDVKSTISGMDVKHSVEDGQLRVLVYNIGPNYIPSGANDLFEVKVDGGLTFVEAKAADFDGNELNMNLKSEILPTNFVLKQNFPNPFNPSTAVTILLPEASEYKIEVYNVSGQLVKSVEGYGVGEVTEVIDFAGQASGIYFYKATAGQYTDTKKMVLMK